MGFAAKEFGNHGSSLAPRFYALRQTKREGICPRAQNKFIV